MMIKDFIKPSFFSSIFSNAHMHMSPLLLPHVFTCSHASKVTKKKEKKTPRIFHNTQWLYNMQRKQQRQERLSLVQKKSR